MFRHFTTKFTKDFGLLELPWPRSYSPYDPLRKSMTMYDKVRQHTTKYDNVRQCTTMYDKVRQSTIKYDNIRQSTTKFMKVCSADYMLEEAWELTFEPLVVFGRLESTLTCNSSGMLLIAWILGVPPWSSFSSRMFLDHGGRLAAPLQIKDMMILMGYMAIK